MKEPNFVGGKKEKTQKENTIKKAKGGGGVENVTPPKKPSNLVSKVGPTKASTGSIIKTVYLPHEDLNNMRNEVELLKRQLGN
jgi:hypothetical protein